MEAFQEKSNERSQLTTALMEVNHKFQMEIDPKSRPNLFFLITRNINTSWMR